MKGSIPLNSSIHSRRLNNQQYNNNKADHVVTTRNISIPLPLPKNHEEQAQLIHNAPHSSVKGMKNCREFLSNFSIDYLITLACFYGT